MELYINSVGVVSGVDNIDQQPSYDTNCMYAAEPDYTQYIPPMQLRRMSKAVRMGIAASKAAMNNAGIESPDALSVGTAMGCLADTEVFLKKMIEQEEQMLTPTAFIQSTHNTVAGQIALLAKCNGYNMTYVHRGHSFEHAIINTQLYLNDNPGQQVLAGGIDELTDGSIAALQRGAVYSEEQLTVEAVVNGSNAGSIAGEGAVFFVVTDKPKSEQAICVKDVVCFTAKDESTATEKVSGFASQHDADLVLLGISGDETYRGFYDSLKSNVFNGKSIATFKQLCGEYAVSSAYALSLLMQGIPDHAYVNEAPTQTKKVIIVNHFMHYYNCWYVELPV